MREDYSFFGGGLLIIGVMFYAISFELPLKLSYILGNDTEFWLRYGGLFCALLGIVILLAGIGTKKGFTAEELGIVRERPKN